MQAPWATVSLPTPEEGVRYPKISRSPACTMQWLQLSGQWNYMGHPLAHKRPSNQSGCSECEVFHSSLNASSNGPKCTFSAASTYGIRGTSWPATAYLDSMSTVFPHNNFLVSARSATASRFRSTFACSLSKVFPDSTSE